MSSRPICSEELRTHRTPSSCWVAFRGIVYDLTTFAASGDHPGGANIIHRYAGTDATVEFDAFHQHVLWDEILGMIKAFPNDVRVGIFVDDRGAATLPERYTVDDNNVPIPSKI